jgi:heavy metal sensor kinase
MVLSVFYYRISSITMENTDDELLEEVEEYRILMAEGGIDAIKTELYDEIESEGEEVFYRILSKDGKMLLSGNLEYYDNTEISQKALEALKNNEEYVIETIETPTHDYKVRTIYGMIAPELILNMGLSLEDNHEYLSIFSNLIFMLMIPLILLAATIGWFLSRHALRGVEEVTQTAIEISKGSMDKRVVVKKRSLEIDTLANTFNSMLDRIQALIKGMREMNDNIAHDLRSPLTRIRGIAEMTLMGNKDIENYSEMAANTIEECDKLIAIINTMLDITETEAGVSNFKSEKVDVVDLIRSACELFDPIAGEKDIKLVTVLPDKLFIRADRSKFQRLITNLLENAIKYNKQGGTVTISVSEQNQQVNIEVEDTGIGIPEKDLPKVFERFYRCDASRSMAGIGLGLSLAKAIAKAFDGDIQVKSAINQGSLFQVTLPA